MLLLCTSIFAFTLIFLIGYYNVIVIDKLSKNRDAQLIGAHDCNQMHTSAVISILTRIVKAKSLLYSGALFNGQVIMLPFMWYNNYDY